MSGRPDPVSDFGGGSTFSLEWTHLRDPPLSSTTAPGIPKWGNVEPSFSIPIVVAINLFFMNQSDGHNLGNYLAQYNTGIMAGLDYFIEEEALSLPTSGVYNLSYHIQCSQVCAICLMNPRDMAFGCGHRTCSECGRSLQPCPFCRRRTSVRIKLYM